VIIYLRLLLPVTSRGLLAESKAELPHQHLAPGRVYLSQAVTNLLVSSYLTVSSLPSNGGFVSVALSRRLPWVGVTHYHALRSPDFPQAFTRNHPTHPYFYYIKVFFVYDKWC
tara:strand:+ start:6444 stop:6782 length:339 start_codon:yes stop_codon:yes gene_type:complete